MVKIIIKSISLCLALLFVCSVFFPIQAHALVASGVKGECTWEIDDMYVLTIRPTNGVSGTLESGYTTWGSNSTYIQKVNIEPGVIAPADSSWLFSSLNNCKEMDMSNLDTSNVTSMYQMFSNCWWMNKLDVSTWNTTNVQNMSEMFTDCYRLSHFDLSSWSTANVTTMADMFLDCNEQAEVDLGAGWTKWMDYAYLNSGYMEHRGDNWVRADETYGPLSAADLYEQYPTNATEMAGKWIREEYDTYTINFLPGGGYGHMDSIKKARTYEDVTLPKSNFYYPGKKLVGWEDKNEGYTYNTNEEGIAQINSYQYSDGTTVNLTAIWEDAPAETTTVTDGEFEITLHNGEYAQLPSMPAGTRYQIYEETEDGWTLISQSGTSGEIVPGENAHAQFVNKYDPESVGINITAQKLFNDIPADEGAFTFDLLEGNANTMSAGEYEAAILQTKQNLAGGMILFDALTFTSPGSHTYSICEKITSEDPDIRYDKHVELVNVEVTKVDDTLLCTVTYDSNGAVFSNKYYPGSLKISKETEGETDQSTGQEFSFKIKFYDEKGIPITGDDLSYYISSSDEP